MILLMRSILLKKRTLGAAAFHELLRTTPVILAVKSMEGLEKSLAGTGKVVFVLFGDLLSIPGIVARLKDQDKIVFAHLDLIDGLSSRDVAVDFLAGNTRIDGILSTRANLVRRARDQGLLAIQRFFVLDSMALISMEKQLPLDYADAVEILPGLMPKVIRKIAALTAKPIIAGGLIADRDDVRHALDAGAAAISTTNIDLALTGR